MRAAPIATLNATAAASAGWPEAGGGHRFVAYFIWLVVYGALAGAIYALVALTFVIVYKVSRTMNFATGEWVMFGALLTSSGLHGFNLAGAGLAGLLGVILLAALAMAAFATALSRVVLRHMTGRSLMAMIMLTLGLGTLMRGLGPIIFKGRANAIASPIESDYIEILGLVLPPERLLSAVVAALCITAVGCFYKYTRTGLALRAIAADPAAASGAGVDVAGHIALSWALAGIVAVVAGVLWSIVSGGGIGTALVGMKVFPIVIIGGLNSIPGCILGAMVIGVADSLASGYLDRLVGSGVSIVVSSLLLLAALWLRPWGLFGERVATRV